MLAAPTTVMGTKRLARTVIEPGRCNFTKNERVFENRSDRRAARVRGHLLTRDPRFEEDDEDRFPVREPIWIHQRDKLSPLTRWLRKQANRPWGDVYAEIRHQCDTRTTPGRHILYDHLLRDVENNGVGEESPNPWRSEWRERFFVDDDGILRHVPAKGRPAYHCDCATHRRHPREGVIARIAGRRVRALGSELFWMVRVEVCAECTGSCGHPARYRQDAALDDEEVAWWRELSSFDHEAFAWKAPDAE